MGRGNNPAPLQESTKYMFPGPSNGVGFGEGVVIAMGPVAASTAIAEQDGARIISPNHRQPPQD